MLSIEKHTLEKINVIKHDSANIFKLSILVLGSIIATSYLALAITPRIEHTLIYKPYKPKSAEDGLIPNINGLIDKWSSQLQQKIKNIIYKYIYNENILDRFKCETKR